MISCGQVAIGHIDSWLDMSFNDLERGESSQPLLRGGPQGISIPLNSLIFMPIADKQPDEDRTFTSLKDSCSIQIFKIQSNVQGIQRLVDKLGGASDGPALRTSLHNLTDATRDLVKKSTEEVKKLAAFPAGGQHVRTPGSAFGYICCILSERSSLIYLVLPQTYSNQALPGICHSFISLPTCSTTISRTPKK